LSAIAADLEGDDDDDDEEGDIAEVDISDVRICLMTRIELNTCCMTEVIRAGHQNHHWLQAVKQIEKDQASAKGSKLPLDPELAKIAAGVPSALGGGPASTPVAAGILSKDDKKALKKAAKEGKEGKKEKRKSEVMDVDGEGEGDAPAGETEEEKKRRKKEKKEKKKAAEAAAVAGEGMVVVEKEKKKKRKSEAWGGVGLGEGGLTL
jgi:nucleolar protein 56